MNGWEDEHCKKVGDEVGLAIVYGDKLHKGNDHVLVDYRARMDEH
jgi:hypothetical protein